MTENFRPEPHVAVDCACIGVQKQLRGVVTQPVSGIERAADPKSVGLSRPDPRHEAVPDVAVAVGQHQLCLRAVGVEQAEPHLITARGHREVGAPRVGRGAERVGRVRARFSVSSSFRILGS